MEARATYRQSGRETRLAYGIGDTVYHRLAAEKAPGLITGILIRPTGHAYHVSYPSGCEHILFEMELTSEYLPSFDV